MRKKITLGRHRRRWEDNIKMSSKRGRGRHELDLSGSAQGCGEFLD
jgi:hypothetical protein